MHSRLVAIESFHFIFERLDETLSLSVGRRMVWRIHFVKDSIEFQKPLELSRRELYAVITHEHSRNPVGSKEFTARMNGSACSDISQNLYFRPFCVGINKHNEIRTHKWTGKVYMDSLKWFLRRFPAV